MNKATEEFLATLDPKTAKRIRTAESTELVRYPLASIGLTQATNGGIGAGRFTMIYGNTSSGKSLLTMQSVGIWQKMGLTCAWVDAEGTYEKSFAARLGIDNDSLLLFQEKTFAGITDKTKPIIKAGVDILVIDSISDIMPDAFVEEGELKDFNKTTQVGAHAKGNTRMLNALHYLNEKTAVVIISQTTTQIEQTYTKQVPHGGKKVEFMVSQMIKLTSSNTDAKQIKKIRPVGNKLIEVPVGRRVEAFVEKNKMGKQHTKASYDIYYDGDFLGIDRDAELIDSAVEWGVANKGGAWFEYDSIKSQGRDRFIDDLKTAGMIKQLENELMLVSTGEVVDD